MFLKPLPPYQLLYMTFSFLSSRALLNGGQSCSEAEVGREGGDKLQEDWATFSCGYSLQLHRWVGSPLVPDRHPGGAVPTGSWPNADRDCVAQHNAHGRGL